MKTFLVSFVFCLVSFSAQACIPTPSLGINQRDIIENEVYRGKVLIADVKYVPNANKGYFIITAHPYVLRGSENKNLKENYIIIDEPQCVASTWKKGDIQNFIIYKDNDNSEIFRAVRILEKEASQASNNTGHFCLHSDECNGVCLDKIREKEDQITLLKERYSSYQEEFLRRQSDGPVKCNDEDQSGSEFLFCDEYKIPTFEEFSQRAKAGICSHLNDDECITDVNGFKFNCRPKKEN